MEETNGGIEKLNPKEKEKMLGEIQDLALYVSKYKDSTPKFQDLPDDLAKLANTIKTAGEYSLILFNEEPELAENILNLTETAKICIRNDIKLAFAYLDNEEDLSHDEIEYLKNLEVYLKENVISVLKQVEMNELIKEIQGRMIEAEFRIINDGKKMDVQDNRGKSDVSDN